MEYAATHDEFTLEELRAAIGVDPDYEFDDANEIWTGTIGEGEFRKIRYPALINYLEFVQLQDARKSSTRALWFAGAGIFIAIALGIIGLVMTFLTQLDYWKTFF